MEILFTLSQNNGSRKSSILYNIRKKIYMFMDRMIAPIKVHSISYKLLQNKTGETLS